MAHIQKVKSFAVGQMVQHTRRLRDAGHYTNERIDAARTADNYQLGGVDDVTAEIGRIARETPRGKLRKDAVAMFSVINTLPGDWPSNRDTREYFEVCHTFNMRFFGGVSLGMNVHMDESRPHAHDLFCPRTPDGRVCYNDVVPRAKYQRYHTELREYVRDRLGLDLSITLGETERALKELSPLAQDEYRAARDALERARAEARAAQREASLARQDARRSRQEAAEAAVRAEMAQKAADAAKEAQKAAEASLAAAEGELADLRGRVGRLQRTRDWMAGDGEYKGREYVDRKTGVTHLPVADLVERRDELEAEVRSLDERARSSRAEVMQLRTEVRQQQSAARQLRAQVDELTRHLEDVVKRVLDMVMQAWREHGPWRRERDSYEIEQAMQRVLDYVDHLPRERVR